MLVRMLPKFTVGDGCWEWTAGLNQGGYGQIWDGCSRPQLAHVAMYRILKGAVPEGLVSDHLCRNRKCIRPDHIEFVTIAENLRRAPNFRGRRTCCPAGHEYTAANTIRDTDGQGRLHRKCRTCKNARDRAYYASH
jgi:hypothetical protein